MALGQDLPDDLVADVLRCLPPRSLAVSRCVCKAWRDLVDVRRLLRADLLPRSVGSIFINYSTLYSPEFLARPTTGPSISGDFEFVPGFFSKVMDHCNGLVLCTSGDHHYVSNPATRQWARLPLPPGPALQIFPQIKCVVYDPTMSPQCDIFLIHFLHKDQHRPGQKTMQCEGSVSLDPLLVYVYSSKIDRWEKRSFALEGRVQSLQTTISVDDKNLNKVYWRGALYLLCENDFILRISISNAKYTLIPAPEDVEFSDYGCFLLGRSKKGPVYCAFQYDWHRLRIFLLNESCGQMVWELRHSVDLKTFARNLHACEDYGDQPNGPWILQDINDYKYPYGNYKRKEVVEHNFEWNSDDDNVVNIEEMVEGHFEGYTGLLGFHPYKEIVFLNAALRRAVAYHWNTSKFQDLGNIYPKDYLEAAGHAAGIDTSFIYTPCWIEDLLKNCQSAPIEGQSNVNMLLEEVIE